VALGSLVQGGQDVGKEFIVEELRKPATLTVAAGTVFFIKANADIPYAPTTR
jgi:hypothetical protein